MTKKPSRLDAVDQRLKSYPYPVLIMFCWSMMFLDRIYKVHKHIVFRYIWKVFKYVTNLIFIGKDTEIHEVDIAGLKRFIEILERTEGLEKIAIQYNSELNKYLVQ